ncbi:MAG: TonB-dependent siderophore receptor [Acidovorax sp.]|nr:TonB-dependent siderophore receptor [Acidovorax sp.]
MSRRHLLSPSAAAPRRTPGHRSVACAIQLLLMGSMVGVGISAARAQDTAPQALAAADAAVRSYAIPAGPLAEVLTRFLSESGLLLATTTELVQGKASPGVQGRFGAADGLAVLLKGTGLEAVRRADGSHVLRVMPVVQVTDADMAEVRVTAEALRESPWAAVDGWVATRGASATKTDTALLETPQAISVITADQMREQAAQTTAEALRYTAGVRTDYSGAQNAGNALMLRGFTTSGQGGAFLDGLRLRTVGYWSEEPFGLERLEFFKGPTSVLFGQSAVPGGAIALVSKRPTSERIGELELSTGTGKRAQVAVDVGGPVNADGSVLYRFVALVRDADMYVDGFRDDRLYLAPSLTWKPGARTRLTLLPSFQKNWASFTSLLPYAAMDGSNPRGRVPMSRNTGAPGFGDTNVLASLGYEFEHAFNDDWSVQQNFRYSYGHSDMRSIYRTSGLIGGALINRSYDLRNMRARNTTVDQQLKGRLATGAVEHRLLLGLDYARYEGDTRVQTGVAPSLDLYQPDYSQPVDTSHYTSRSNQLERTAQLGFYAQDQMRWQNWVGTLGVRHDKVSTRIDDRLANAVLTDRDWSATTARAGLNYVFDSGWAPYVSYSQSFNPVSGTSSPARGSRPFDPERGVQREVGVKFQPAGAKSFFTVTAFDLRRQNVSTMDPDNSNYSVQTGEVRARGVELEGVGQITRDLKMVGAYSVLDIETTRDTLASNIGKSPARVPAHLASLWLDYAFNEGPVQGLSVGVGARYTGASWGDAANTFKVPAYTLWDLALRYDLGRTNPAWRGWSASLNVRNLTDRYYVASCAFSLGCNLGEGRTAIAKLNYKW